MQLCDAVLPCLVLGLCSIRDIQHGDAANLESLYIRIVTLLGNGVRFACDAQLLSLVVELLRQDEDILPELLRLLPELALHYLAVAFRHLALSLAFAPVKDRDGEAHLHHLLAQQVAIGTAHALCHSRIAQLRIQADAPAVGLCRCHIVVSLQLTAPHCRGKGIILQGMGQDIIIRKMQSPLPAPLLGECWHYWFNLRLYIQERLQGKLSGLTVALAVCQGTMGVQHIQLQL